MKRTPVSSSNLKSVGYDPITTTLEIEFLSGRVYQYYGVSQLVYNQLMAASSHGSFFNAYIRDNYRYRQL